MYMIYVIDLDSVIMLSSEVTDVGFWVIVTHIAVLHTHVLVHRQYSMMQIKQNPSESFELYTELYILKWRNA